jgi:hypothetical protein
MTDTPTATNRTARRAGTAAVITVLATAMVLEPELQDRGLGTLALAIYAVAVPVIAWSVYADVRRLRR